MNLGLFIWLFVLKVATTKCEGKRHKSQLRDQHCDTGHTSLLLSGKQLMPWGMGMDHPFNFYPFHCRSLKLLIIYKSDTSVLTSEYKMTVMIKAWEPDSLMLHTASCLCHNMSRVRQMNSHSVYLSRISTWSIPTLLFL